MAKTSSIRRSRGIQYGRLPLRRALALIAALSIASWAALIVVVYLGRLAICSLGIKAGVGVAGADSPSRRFRRIFSGCSLTFPPRIVLLSPRCYATRLLPTASPCRPASTHARHPQSWSRWYPRRSHR